MQQQKQNLRQSENKQMKQLSVLYTIFTRFYVFLCMVQVLIPNALNKQKTIDRSNNLRNESDNEFYSSI